MYVGTYTESLPHVRGRGPGIEICRLSLSSGVLTAVGSARSVVNPSYLAVAPHRRLLFCVEEVEGGRVRSFAIDGQTGVLAAIGSQSSGGAWPAHLSVDRDGRWLFVANYASGSVAAIPVEGDGRLAPPRSVARHPGRPQEGPHAHWIGTDPAGRLVLVADLGMNAIVRYPADEHLGFDAGAGDVTAAARPGAGPRHLAFASDGRRVFAANELDSTLVVYAYEAPSGALEPRQRVATLPRQFSGSSWAGGIRLAESGRSLYVTNRGHDSVAAFRVDPVSGETTLLGHAPCLGRTPRDLAVAPTGRFLLVANQDGDTVVTFSLDPESGEIRGVAHVLPIYHRPAFSLDP